MYITHFSSLFIYCNLPHYQFLNLSRINGFKVQKSPENQQEIAAFFIYIQILSTNTILIPTVTPDIQKIKIILTKRDEKMNFFTPNYEAEHKCGRKKFCVAPKLLFF